MSSRLHREILSYPYWGRDTTQDPLRIAGGMVNRVIEDVDINQEPGRTDYNNNNVSLIMRPAVRQDTSQMATAGDSPTYGVTDPTRLYTALLASVPDVNPKARRSQNGS